MYPKKPNKMDCCASEIVKIRNLKVVKMDNYESITCIASSERK